MSTLERLANALAVKPEDLLPDGHVLARKAGSMGIQIVLEGDIEKFRDTPFGNQLLLLLRMILPALMDLRIIDIKGGSVIITVECTRQDALELVSIFPMFKEHVRAAVGAAPAGEAYFRGIDTQSAAARNVIEMLELASTVRELRIAAEPDAPMPVEPDEQPEPPPASAPTQSPESLTPAETYDIDKAEEMVSLASMDQDDLPMLYDLLKNAEAAPCSVETIRFEGVLSKMDSVNPLGIRRCLMIDQMVSTEQQHHRAIGVTS